jgi:signal peptidase I
MVRPMNDRGWLLRALPNPSLRWAAGAVFPFTAIVPVLLVRSAMVEPFRIPAGSMVPALYVGDHVLVAKSRYGLRLPLLGRVASWRVPERGDIVVFLYPRDESLHYVKRVIGLPGDRIEVRNHRVVLNGTYHPWESTGETLTEPFHDCAPTDLPLWRETLPTTDGGSRSWTVTANRGMPGALANLPELEVKPGHVFVLGDNRDNSEDSRRWGFVALDRIMGPVQTVWFSSDECTGKVRSDRMFQSVVPEVR